MKLTINQLYALQGFRNINYAKVKPVDAIAVYRLRRDIVRVLREMDDMRQEFVEAVWPDKLLKKAQEYEKTKEGMTEEEYKAAVAEYMPKVQDLMKEAGKSERVIAEGESISFESWLQLLQDNSWLAGTEDLLADFIDEN